MFGKFFKVHETQTFLSGPIPLAMGILVAEFPAPLHVIECLHKFRLKASFGIIREKRFSSSLDSLLCIALIEKCSDRKVHLVLNGNETGTHAHFKFTIAREHTPN